jgi:hypothetical protein
MAISAELFAGFATILPLFQVNATRDCTRHYAKPGLNGIF